VSQPVETPPSATSTPPAPPAEQTAPPAATGVEKTPEWYEKELSRTRDEAARYRTRLRDTETKFAGAKSQADYDAAVAELTASNSKLARDLLVATVGAGLPDELRVLLKGDTAEELAAHAEVLKKFIPATEQAPPPPGSLQGGLDPSKDPDAFDPDQFADDWRSGRISRASISGRTY
jgi:hypothetical protein